MSAFALDGRRDREFQRTFRKALVISLACHGAVVLMMALSSMFGGNTQKLPRTMPVSLMSAPPGPKPSAATPPPAKKKKQKAVAKPPPEKPQKKPEPKKEPEPEPEPESKKEPEPEPEPEPKKEKKTPKKKAPDKPEKKISPRKKEDSVKKNQQKEKEEPKKKKEKAESIEPPSPPGKDEQKVSKNESPSTLASNPDIEAARRLRAGASSGTTTTKETSWNSASELIKEDPRMKTYHSTIGGQIRDYWILPPSVPEGQGLHVDVIVTVDQKGNVLDHEIVHKSGHPDFDQSVKDLIQKLERLPAVPVEVPGGELELPLRFVPEGYER
ncbi:MAG: TonB family protein [bacterium]